MSVYFQVIYERNIKHRLDSYFIRGNKNLLFQVEPYVIIEIL